jgi:hypothetical protein
VRGLARFRPLHNRIQLSGSRLDNGINPPRLRLHQSVFRCEIRRLERKKATVREEKPEEESRTRTPYPAVIIVPHSRSASPRIPSPTPTGNRYAASPLPRPPLPALSSCSRPPLVTFRLFRHLVKRPTLDIGRPLGVLGRRVSCPTQGALYLLRCFARVVVRSRP